MLKISSKTLNMLNASEAFIKVKPNYCGLIPATVTIADEKYGSFTIRVATNHRPLSEVSGISNMNYEELSNPLDVERIRRILEDEWTNFIRNNVEAERSQPEEEKYLNLGIQEDVLEGNLNQPAGIEDSTKIEMINEEREFVGEEQESPLNHTVSPINEP